MNFAEQQYHAHLERQRRLGKVPVRALSPRMAMDASPASAGMRAGQSAALEQAPMIKALQQKIAQLIAQLEAMERGDESPLVGPGRIKPVISAVAKYYRVSLRDLIAFRRTRNVTRPRQVAMYLARALTKHSLPAIGRVFERDHTTILHVCRQIAVLRQRDPGLDAEIRELMARLSPPAAFASLDKQRC